MKRRLERWCPAFSKVFPFVISCACILSASAQNAHTTTNPKVGTNRSYRNDVGWKIEKIKSTPESLTVLFSVDKQSLFRTPKTITGMSRLMCLCPYDEEFQRLISNSKSSSSAAGQSADDWWSQIRNLDNLRGMAWVSDMQEPTINSVKVRYWSDFSRRFSLSDRELSIPAVVEVTFPPVEPGVETISIVDYGMRNQFLDIEIKNPYRSGIQTGYSESDLKEEWGMYGFDAFEGTYEMLTYPEYKFGLKATESGKYVLIYLESDDSRGWESGELKAEVIPSATPGLFKASWIMSNKTDVSEVLLSIDGGTMEVVGLEEELLFLKMFPTSGMSGKNQRTGSTGFVGSGSAVVVDDNNGYLVTNYHVATAGNEIRALIDGKEYPLSVSALDEANDLALLRFTGNWSARLVSLPISMNDKLGDPIVTAGYPLQNVLGSDIKVTEGVISSTSYLGSSNMYQISAPITNGSSGGALLDASGNLAGITQGGYRPDSNTENVNAAVKSIMILALAQAESDCELKIGDSSVSIKFNSLDNSVVPLKVYN